jgi:hypothetical protein
MGKTAMKRNGSAAAEQQVALISFEACVRVAAVLESFG